MRALAVMAALALTGCQGYVKTFSVGIAHKETRLDATWSFSGKEPVRAQK